MSVISKNPFDLLGDDGEPSPAPAQAKAAAAPKAQAAAAPQRAIPGSAPRGSANRGRGGNSTRGARTQGGESRNSGPAEDVQEGFEHPAGFDGERVPPPKKSHKGPDAHTKGPRESRPTKNATAGGQSRGGAGKGRTANGGGERRQFERRSGTVPDSQKRVESGWGADEGEAELNAEQQGEKDAQDEDNTPQTPAAEGADGGWGAAETDATVAPAAPVEEEEEEVTKSYDEYLAERAASQISGLGKKEARQVNSETVEGTQFRREAINDFFHGKEKSTKARTTSKKEKVYIEVDGQFASPTGGAPSGGRGGRGGERGRGGRGGGRGGDRGGRGTGAGRGAPRGRAAPRGGRSGAVDANDEKAFPALGA